MVVAAGLVGFDFDGGEGRAAVLRGDDFFPDLVMELGIARLSIIKLAERWKHREAVETPAKYHVKAAKSTVCAIYRQSSGLNKAS